MATSEQLTHLLQLGFDETESIAALKKNNNNANSAAEYLLAKKNTSPQSQQITHTEEIILNGLYKCMECDLFFETLDNSIAHGEESSHATFQKPILKVNIDLNQQTLNEIEKIKTASVEKINQDNPNGSLASRIAELDRIYASKGGESNRRYHNRREQAMLAARQAENKALQKGSSVEEARQEYERALKSKMSLNPPVENWLASKSFEDRIDALLDGAQAMVESRKMDKDDLKKMLDVLLNLCNRILENPSNEKKSRVHKNTKFQVLVWRHYHGMKILLELGFEERNGRRALLVLPDVENKIEKLSCVRDKIRERT